MPEKTKLILFSSGNLRWIIQDLGFAVFPAIYYNIVVFVLNQNLHKMDVKTYLKKKRWMLNVHGGSTKDMRANVLDFVS